MGSDFRARRGLRALAVSNRHELGARSARPTARAARPRRPTCSARQQGAQWLANQIKTNGGFLQNFGKPDPVDTAYAVIGMRAAGVDKPASDLAIAYLKTHDRDRAPAGGHDSPGALAEYIMAAVADGQDPRHFGGTGAQNNLVEPAARDRAHRRRRQGPVRRAGPDVRRRVPPGPRAGRAQGGRRVAHTDAAREPPASRG